ncbi:ABC transporter substrate-binding protein [Bradyrhizobium sp. ISRA443]|uniref:ABC transporter substrate-binding protein n=1 Tax=unclassified Bradyrhizobium TaxID=2631580 RepID=UPI002479C436|nr:MULTISPECIES: ABC transporter substrate-binding protein [unclassified Bradyrhizobium]WGR93062.1 ABC transporter substrate-binding protein [Bradyrhizobium sp. ISRA435]WGS02757.1 ABC transporter substrate-binding protein [Bradyrhizobium sp. ISRA436]WGS09642.1 ABC transporter substrate-binding protein [Bradyrhizobium sp. ISRA437]WGS16528.1 ABC transporter substrate-binding protein [Bradyrhizobium sp. ISRA443]
MLGIQARLVRGAVVLVATLGAASARAAGTYDTGANDTTIKLGQTMPYSGPASAYSAIGRAEIAYFKMVNERGGINGRKVELISMDDAYSPPKTVEQVRRLVESDEVLAMFSMLGTGPNIAAQKYLNGKKVPQLFPSSGASRWNDPKHFPWTTGSQPTYRTEGRIYAKWILANKPDAKIAVITPNEDPGRDYLAGFKEGLGEHVNQIVSEAVYETSDPTVDSQIVRFKSAGADVLFDECTPKFAAQAIKKAAELGWKPQIILPTVSNSVGSVLTPAGLDNAVGIVTGAFLKDPGDPRWADDPGMKAWREWMKTYNPGADPADVFNVTGYTMAQMMELVLQRAGNDLTRSNLMKQTQSFKDVELPMLLPGIKLNTSADQLTPIRQLQMARFNGKSWELFGDVLGE